MEAKHTATPWKITDAPFQIVNESGAMVAKLTSLDLPNAEFIIRACNSHDVLLAAVHHALTSEDGPSTRDVLRAALSHAGGLPDDFDLDAALSRATGA